MFNPMSNKLVAEYTENINKELDHLPINSLQDFDNIKNILEGIIINKEIEIEPNELNERIISIKSLLQSLELWVANPNHFLEYKEIITGRIAAKVNEIANMTLSEKESYIELQENQRNNVTASHEMMANATPPEEGTEGHTVSLIQHLQELQGTLNREEAGFPLPGSFLPELQGLPRPRRDIQSIYRNNLIDILVQRINANSDQLLSETMSDRLDLDTPPSTEVRTFRDMLSMHQQINEPSSSGISSDIDRGIHISSSHITGSEEVFTPELMSIGSGVLAFEEISDEILNGIRSTYPDWYEQEEDSEATPEPISESQNTFQREGRGFPLSDGSVPLLGPRPSPGRYFQEFPRITLGYEMQAFFDSPARPYSPAMLERIASVTPPEEQPFRLTRTMHQSFRISSDIDRGIHISSSHITESEEPLAPETIPTEVLQRIDEMAREYLNLQQPTNPNLSEEETDEQSFEFEE